MLARPGAAEAFADFHLAAAQWGLDLGLLRVATTIWHGGSDRNAPVAAAHWLHERLPTSRLEVSPADGHASLLATRGASILADLAAN